MDQLVVKQISARYNSLNSRWQETDSVSILASLLSDAGIQANEAYKIADAEERQAWLEKYRDMSMKMSARLTELATDHLKTHLPDGVEYKQENDKIQGIGGHPWPNQLA